MRARYLFGLAHLCGLGPAQVDALTVGDFLSLTDAVDEVEKAHRQARAHTGV